MQDGEARLAKYELVDRASRYLRTATLPPLRVLLQLYGVRRLESLSMDELLDFVRRAKAGTLWPVKPPRAGRRGL